MIQHHWYMVAAVQEEIDRKRQICDPFSWLGSIEIRREVQMLHLPTIDPQQVPQRRRLHTNSSATEVPDETYAPWQDLPKALQSSA